MAVRLTTLKRAAVESRRMLESKLQPRSLDIFRSPYRFAAACFTGVVSGSMELMDVPKKKVYKHKRGIRNGPNALKHTPVIIRCRSCGRVKLPHFYCCSDERAIPDVQRN